MPNLKQGEYMHTCESDICSSTTGGSRRGKPRPYIVRKYYSDIERKYCSTCCRIKEVSGQIRSIYDDKGVWNGYEMTEGLT